MPEQIMNRRRALQTVAAGVGACLAGRFTPALALEQPAAGLGIVIYCLAKKREWLRKQDPNQDLFEPNRYLQYCRGLGAGGVQLPLGIRDEAYAAALREQAQQHGMFVEAIVGPPQDQADLERFDAEMKTAARAGARVARTVIMPGRRYERFGSIEEFNEFDRRGRESLQRAEPVAARHRLRLAVENHKGHRIDQRIALLQHLDSEWIGACVDFGNNLALLEDPLELVKALAPWAASVHVKDHAVREYEDGFLLADVPLGRGFLNLTEMTAILRQKHPQLNFSLELITRDPLEVPCLTEKYWATFADTPARDLARTLRTVRSHAVAELPSVDRLPLEEQVAMEHANVTESLEYAAAHLRS
jgi:sugar phosphate isomerase/epimerase